MCDLVVVILRPSFLVDRMRGRVLGCSEGVNNAAQGLEPVGLGRKKHNDSNKSI